MVLKKNLISALIIATGVCFLVVGTMRQEHITLLQKAARLCLECVGIG